jgi:chaperone modulatory protein CbpM
MKARRLQLDLGLNLSGVALALELLDEIEMLRSRVGMLEADHD